MGLLPPVKTQITVPIRQVNVLSSGLDQFRSKPEERTFTCLIGTVICLSTLHSPVHNPSPTDIKNKYNKSEVLKIWI